MGRRRVFASLRSGRARLVELIGPVGLTWRFWRLLCRDLPLPVSVLALWSIEVVDQHKVTAKTAASRMSGRVLLLSRAE